MAAGFLRTSSASQMLHILVVVMFVVPFATSKSASRFSRGHSLPNQKRPTSSLLRTRHRRVLKEARTDTPSRSPDTANSSSTSSDTPFTTSSFGLIDKSSPAPTSTPVATTVLADRTFRQEQETSSESERPRRRRLVAILVPVLTVSFLGLAFAALFAVRRHRRRNEIYAELGSDGSSSASQSVSPPEDTDSLPPVTTEAAAPQFVLPQLPRLSHLVTRKATRTDGDDPIVMHVQRLEIADVGDVVDSGITVFAGAVQLTLALEQALQNYGIEDGQQQPSLVESLHSDESSDVSDDLSDDTADHDPCEYLSGPIAKESLVAQKSRALPQSVDEELMERPTRLRQGAGKDVELGTTDERNKSSSWEDFQCCNRTSWLEGSGNQSRLEVDCDPTSSSQQRQSDNDPLAWKVFLETASRDPTWDDNDKLELRYMEPAETDVSSSSCSA